MLIRIIDDDPEARSSTDFMLKIAGWQTAGYASAAEFLEQGDMTRPGCIVLDLRMPDMNGLELQLELINRHCGVPVIFLSGHGTLSTAVHTLKRGAVDFIEKGGDAGALREAVALAAAKSLTLCREQAQADAAREAYASLTDREKEVARGVVQGHLNKVIAAELGISERTVKMHRANLCAKLGVKNAVELADRLRGLTGEAL